MSWVSVHHDAVERVEDPKEGHGAAHRRGPREDHEKAEEPLPGKSRMRACARTPAPTRTIACETSVKMIVPQRAAEVLLATPSSYSWKPTKSSVSDPRRCVGEAEVDGEDERGSDQQDDEDGPQEHQERAEEAAPSKTSRQRRPWEPAVTVATSAGIVNGVSRT